MSRSKKNRFEGGFFAVPKMILSSNAYLKLRAPEVKLLLDIGEQYTGHNNGHLTACHTLLKKRGWSKSSLHRALNNLIHAGFLVVTRQGRKVRGYATLLAITWLSIDEPKPGKPYDEGIEPSNKSLGYWCKIKSSWEHQPGRKDYNESISPD